LKVWYGSRYHITERFSGIDETVDPIYVSETVEKTMNPTFRRIDFEACGPGIMRSKRLMLRAWVKSMRMQGWRQLLEFDVELGGLQYLGKSACLSSVHVRDYR
jgi:hypothetical protein